MVRGRPGRVQPGRALTRRGARLTSVDLISADHRPNQARWPLTGILQPDVRALSSVSPTRQIYYGWWEVREQGIKSPHKTPNDSNHSVEAPQHKPTASALQALKQRVIQLVELQGVLQQSNEERNSDLQEALADLRQLAAEHDQLKQEIAQLREEKDQLLTTLQGRNGQVEPLQQQQETFSDSLKHHPVLGGWIDEGSDPITALEKRLAEGQQSTDTCHALTEERDGLIKKLGSAEKHLQQTREALHHIFPKEAYRERRPDLETLSDNGLVEHFTYHGINEGVSLDHDTLREALLAKPNVANSELTVKISELQTLIDDYAKRLSFMNDLFVRLTLEGHSKS